MNLAFPSPQVDDEAKLRFAEAFLRSNNAATAAMDVFPADPGKALQLAQTLPQDSIVIAEIERLKEEKGEAAFLPNKAKIARDVYERATEAKDNEEYVKLMRLYGDLMGMIEKPGSSVNVDVKVAPVMVMRDHGSDDQWEQRASAQQRGLTLNAAD